MTLQSPEHSHHDLLKQAWQRSASKHAADEQVINHWFDWLCACYQEGSRHYHTLSHIRHMLELANEFQSEITHWEAFNLAIWFHDCVQSLGPLNEKVSAYYCRRAMRDLGFTKSEIQYSDRLIRSTKSHVHHASDDVPLFIDIDLAVLGSERKRYQTYAQACRKEYPTWAPLYQLGRRKVLTGFLERTHIFNTAPMKARFEDAARENLRWEINSLIQEGVSSK